MLESTKGAQKMAFSTQGVGEARMFKSARLYKMTAGLLRKDKLALLYRYGFGSTSSKIEERGPTSPGTRSF